MKEIEFETANGRGGPVVQGILERCLEAEPLPTREIRVK